MNTRFAIRVLSVLLLVSLSALGQTNDPQTEMNEAFGLFLNGKTSSGIRRIQEIAEQNRGTDVGRKALEFLAGHTDEAKSRAFLQQIISDFPGTTHETRARMGLLGWDFEDNPNKEAYIDGCNAIATALGGPSLDEILSSGGSPELTAAIRALGRTKQEQLLEVYPSLQILVGSDYPALIPGDTGDGEASQRILLFLRCAFGPLGIGYDGIEPIARDADAADSFFVPPTFVDPVVTFQSPTPGSSTDPQPIIHARITVGDLNKYQVDLNALQVALDGTDVKGFAAFQMSYGEIRVDEVFETIDVTYQPTSPLVDGLHTFVLDVPTLQYPGEGPGKTVATLEFTVQTTGTDVSLRALQDSTLTQRNSHSNEGANSVLTLEKVDGKAARSVVEFDLANVNLNGLTQATLMLTVNPDEKVTGWGRECQEHNQRYSRGNSHGHRNRGHSNSGHRSGGRYGGHGGHNGHGHHFGSRPTQDTISAFPITVEWAEGNGRHFGLRRHREESGSGAGVTWFSPIDEDISNRRPDSATQWNGGATGATTSSPFEMTNHYEGTVEFDVTQDLLNGQGQYGWLIRKDDENRGSKVSFYSREGAALAGDETLAPTLILDYGTQTASSDSSDADGLLAKLGFGNSKPRLVLKSGATELPTFRERLKDSPVAILVGEAVVTTSVGPNPVAKLAARTAYRAWLDQGIG